MPFPNVLMSVTIFALVEKNPTWHVTCAIWSRHNHVFGDDKTFTRHIAHHPRPIRTGPAPRGPALPEEMTCGINTIHRKPSPILIIGNSLIYNPYVLCVLVPRFKSCNRPLENMTECLLHISLQHLWDVFTNYPVFQERTVAWEASQMMESLKQLSHSTSLAHFPCLRLQLRRFYMATRQLVQDFLKFSSPANW